MTRWCGCGTSRRVANSPALRGIRVRSRRWRSARMVAASRQRAVTRRVTVGRVTGARASLPGHTAGVKLVAFSSDGPVWPRQASMANLYIWDAASEAPNLDRFRRAPGLDSFPPPPPSRPRPSSWTGSSARPDPQRTGSRQGPKDLAGPIWQTSLRLIREVRPIVEALFNRLLLRSRVLEAIRTDVSIDPRVRAGAHRPGRKPAGARVRIE